MIKNTGKLAGRTIFITGASRGIGKAIVLKAAADGANIIVAAKTVTPHAKLAGTIYTAAEEIEKAGGKALPCVLDVRDEAQVKAAVKLAVEKFGGIDILVNNASAISLTGTLETDMKRYDLMHSINTRGTFLVSKECIPYLKKSSHAHILNISPPLNMHPGWFGPHVAYTMAKYGMSMCVLGMARELAKDNIAVNALWPETFILTAATEMLTGPSTAEFSRKPDIMADAAYLLLSKSPKEAGTGQFLVDSEVVTAGGVTDLTQYSCIPGNTNLAKDAFLGLPPNESEIEQSTTPASASPNQADFTGKIGGLFKSIQATLNPELVTKTQAVYQFNVTGEEPGTWHLDLKDGSGSVGRGEPSNKADSVLTMDSKNFFDMFTGKLKPATAYMMGKLKISGDLKKAMKLEKLMGSLKSKL